MRYFELLNLRREPFSNSPDPELFYRTKQHQECLQKLEIALRLKRGLNVVTGHVGTGKTTLCRQIIRVLADRQGVTTHLLLDPSFSDPEEFLAYLNTAFGVEEAKRQGASQWQLRENIKAVLFRQAVEEDRLVVLIVDEGQKMSLACLEILRELLNFETNEHKLLQIVIFGQLEFDALLAGQANLADRVNLHLRLGPLDFKDTRELILARLTMCAKDMAPEGLFSPGAFWAVYLATHGFPRQIVQLCHQALLAVIIKERQRVTWSVVRSCMRWRNLGVPRRRRWPWAVGLAAAALLGLFLLAGRGGLARLDLAGQDAGLTAQGQPAAGDFGLKGHGGPAAGDAGLTAQGGPAAGNAGQTAQGGPAGKDAGLIARWRELAGRVTLPVLPGISQLGAYFPRPAPLAGASSVAATEPRPPEAAAPGDQASGTEGGALPGGQPGQPGSRSSALGPVEDQGQAQASPANQETEQAAAAPAAPQGVPARHGAQARYTGVRVRDDGQAAELVILTDGDAPGRGGPGGAGGRYEVALKAGPARIVVEFPGVWDRQADRMIAVGGAHIEKVRSALQPDRLKVVIYLANAGSLPREPGVERVPEGLKLTVRN